VSVRAAEFSQFLSRVARSFHANRIVLDNRGFAESHHERRHVHGDPGACGNKGEFAKPDELMHHARSTDYRGFLYLYVAGQQDVVVDFDVSAQQAVVTDVTIGHEQATIIDACLRFRLGSAVNRGSFSDDHSVADAAVAALSTVMKILREIAHDCEWVEVALFADFRPAVDESMRAYSGSSSDPHRSLDDYVRADLGGCVDAGFRVDDGGFMNGQGGGSCVLGDSSGLLTIQPAERHDADAHHCPASPGTLRSYVKYSTFEQRIHQRHSIAL
jgi:hypothetical protein